MTRSLVTGGAGFIGSHLVEALVRLGQTVRVLDNLRTGTWANLAPVADAIELIEENVSDLDTVRAASADVECVFHLAGQPSLGSSVEDPLATHRAAVQGTLHVLTAARATGVRRVIFAASAAAYGNAEALPNREADATLPHSPYAIAVLSGEEYCAVFGQLYGLETVRLRYFNVFGPRQPARTPHAAAVPSFIEAVAANRSPVVHGDGLQSRDFTCVGDVVQANLLAAETPRAAGRLYNIGSGKGTPVLELLEMINDLLGMHVKPIHVNPRPGEVRHSRADIARAQVELGYCPCTDLPQNLRQCIDYYTAAPRAHNQGPHCKKAFVAVDGKAV